MDIKSLLEARSADDRYIQELERERRNCSQEIGKDLHFDLSLAQNSVFFFS